MAAEASADRSTWVMGQLLASRASTHPERIYAEFPDGTELSYGALDLDANRIANGLSAIGVGFAEPVAVMVPNRPLFLRAWFAINRLGAILTPINTAYKGRFLEHVINDSGTRTAIVSEEYLALFEASRDRMPGLQRIYVAGGDGALSGGGAKPAILPFDQLLSAGGEPPEIEVAPHDVSMILYTSGTTGPSKGVRQTHAHVYLNAHLYTENLRLRGDDIFYCCLPLFHANGLHLLALGAMILGARVFFADRFSASRWLGDIRRIGATVTNMLGVMSEFIWRQPEQEDDSDNPLRVACMVPIPPSYGAAFERRFGLRLIELFGMTESNCPIYMPYDVGLRPGSCGKVLDEWFEVAVVDPDTDEVLPPDTVGELVVRNKAPWIMMANYHGHPEATVEAWRNLWFHTGDAFKYDHEGYYYFVDRIKDCIRCRGENISSFEVEAAMTAHPAAAEVAAVGVPSAIEGGEQDVLVCVVLADGQNGDEELARRLFGHAADIMPAYAVPRWIRFMSALPKTPTEKVQKQILREAGVTLDSIDTGPWRPDKA